MQVIWNAEKCCHAGVCVKSLPDVFKVEAGKFTIDPSQASPEAIKNVACQCPSGALTVNEK